MIPWDADITVYGPTALPFHPSCRNALTSLESNEKKQVPNGGRGQLVLAVDPGVTGAFVMTDGCRTLWFQAMPTESNGKDRWPSFRGIRKLLRTLSPMPEHVFVERAVPFAMGVKGAFNYGRGFEAVLNALEDTGLPITLVEPARWTKAMHAGVAGELRPKAKSVIAAGRLYPGLFQMLPRDKKGWPDPGVLDALLIAGFGLRILNSGC